MRFAQYGISHDHAAGKARVIRASDQVELAGIYEPSARVREELGANPDYAGVHWFSTREEMLEDDGIAAIAVEGEIFQNAGFAREAVEHGKHVWLDKPAGGDPPWFADNTAAVFEYSGAMASVESAYMEVLSVQSRRLEVYGTRGSAILEPFEPPAQRPVPGPRPRRLRQGLADRPDHAPAALLRRPRRAARRHPRRSASGTLARPRTHRAGNPAARHRPRSEGRRTTERLTTSSASSIAKAP